MDDSTLRTLGRLFDQAAETLDDDHFFALVLLMDPDGSLDQQIRALEDADWEAERARMTPEERAELDAAGERGVERGLAIIREVLARKGT